MLQNSISAKNNHKKFIKEVTLHEIVWGLESEEGFATSSSNDFEDENGEPIGLICFWSNKKLAKVCAKEDWSRYKVSSINLSDFLENWCVGMQNDNLLVGTNFDWNLFGQEIAPLDLILEITSSLQNSGKELSFNKFEGILDLKDQVENILNE